MKYLPLLSVLFVTSPALAHEGAHIAPHGAEWMPVFMGLAVIALAGFVGLRTRARDQGRARK